METVTVGSICRARSQMVAVAYLFFIPRQAPLALSKNADQDTSGMSCLIGGSPRCKLPCNVKRYQDIVGDGGSRVLEQVAEQRSRIADGLAGVRHLVAVGSGKGGVGKSTLTLHLAGALRARGLRIAILDADFNGPSQARMAGVQQAVFVPRLCQKASARQAAATRSRFRAPGTGSRSSRWAR